MSIPSGFTDEPSAAIHINNGATNQLLIVMRGHHYLSFVNGQFVGGYSEIVLLSGRNGLWMEDAYVTANLTVYSAPA